jgi:methylenetetrahydrofolate dehydrogenase (NADP+)/methenyltetrahydrofolate cyclohydrolase
MKLIYSKRIVSERKAALTEATRALIARGIRPKLAAVVCSADPAVASYVSVKRKHTEEVGGSFEVLDLSTSSAFADVERRMKSLCDRADVHGVILVMSSKPEMDEIDLTNVIPAGKDVDGLSAANLGALVQNGPHQMFTAPATPQACLVLAASETELKGKQAVVIGRGRTVGRPLANMLISAGATVTVCHSGTRDIPQITRTAEVVFVATGRPHHFGKEYFRDGQVIIDAGIGFIDDKLAGDVDIAGLADLDVCLTPVPGGVGPLTSVLILENLLKLIEIQGGNE